MLWEHTQRAITFLQAVDWIYDSDSMKKWIFKTYRPGLHDIDHLSHHQIRQQSQNTQIRSEHRGESTHPWSASWTRAGGDWFRELLLDFKGLLLNFGDFCWSLVFALMFGSVSISWLGLSGVTFPWDLIQFAVYMPVLVISHLQFVFTIKLRRLPYQNWGLDWHSYIVDLQPLKPIIWRARSYPSTLHWR